MAVLEWTVGRRQDDPRPTGFVRATATRARKGLEFSAIVSRHCQRSGSEHATYYHSINDWSSPLARGESAAHIRPGDGLHRSAIELGHAAVHLGRPRGPGVLVHLGVKTLQQQSGECRCFTRRWPGYTARRSPHLLRPLSIRKPAQKPEAPHGLIDAIVLTPDHGELRDQA